MTEAIVIRGQAYQRPATLAVTDDTLIWRAQRGTLSSARENIATTAHEIRDVTLLEKRWSAGAGVLAALAAIWIYDGKVLVGLMTLAFAIGFAIYRRARPRYWLGLDLGTRWLVIRVDATSASDARTLAGRIERRLLTGEIAVTSPLP